ncbi:MAG: antitoxin family protein [Acidobacteria bacterium]|nr:antitoxin family protein [Acidobacteriota bacterium]MBI3655138.1 antitoxin family protein [Acidobacteriota bacterium]
MGKTIQAVYENGVFRPLDPVELTEGERVIVEIPPKLTPEEIQRSLSALHLFVDAFSDASEEARQRFDEAVQRRSLFAGRQPDL